MSNPSCIGQGLKLEPFYLTGLNGFTRTRGKFDSFRIASHFPEWYYCPSVDYYNYLCTVHQDSASSSADNSNSEAGDDSNYFGYGQGYVNTDYTGGKWCSCSSSANSDNGVYLAQGYGKIGWGDTGSWGWGSSTIRGLAKCKVPPINCRLQMSFYYSSSGSGYISWSSGPSYDRHIEIDGTSITTTPGTYTWDFIWVSPSKLKINGTVYDVTDAILEVQYQVSGTVTQSKHHDGWGAWIKFIQELPCDCIDIPVQQ